MGFAQFILNIEANGKGVATGVNTAIGHFKRLGATINAISRRQEEDRKRERDALPLQDKLNNLLRTRQQIVNRISKAGNMVAKNGYLQKQLEIERQITARPERPPHRREVPQCTDSRKDGGAVGGQPGSSAREGRFVPRSLRMS